MLEVSDTLFDMLSIFTLACGFRDTIQKRTEGISPLVIECLKLLLCPRWEIVINRTRLQISQHLLIGGKFLLHHFA